MGGVSKNRGGPPKWMVKIMETPIKINDLEGTPILGNAHITCIIRSMWVISPLQLTSYHLRLPPLSPQVASVRCRWLNGNFLRS